jgi:di/tripeptidase
MFNEHSTNEKLNIKSTELTYSLLKNILKKLKLNIKTEL